jgi:hypothetical protein
MGDLRKYGHHSNTIISQVQLPENGACDIFLKTS